MEGRYRRRINSALCGDHVDQHGGACDRRRPEPASRYALRVCASTARTPSTSRSGPSVAAIRSCQPSLASPAEMRTLSSLLRLPAPRPQDDRHFRPPGSGLRPGSAPARLICEPKGGPGTQGARLPWPYRIDRGICRSRARPWPGCEAKPVRSRCAPTHPQD
jgi:hypothetical protein